MKIHPFHLPWIRAWLDEGVRLGMLLLLEAEPAPDEIKYSIVIGNDVFQDFQNKRRIPFS